MHKRFFLLVVTIVFTNMGVAAAQSPPQKCSTGTHANDQGMPGIDCSSIDLVIRNDRYTISLLEQVLKQAYQPEFKALLQEHIRAQQQSMDKMSALRKTWYGQP